MNLTPQQRYDYFIRQVADFEEVWTIAVDDGYIMFKDNEGDEIFPVWPHKELAELCCFEEHKAMGAFPESIEFGTFVNECIPDMIKGKVYFGVFYDKKRIGMAIDGNQLKEDLESEYDEING